MFSMEKNPTDKELIFMVKESLSRAQFDMEQMIEDRTVELRQTNEKLKMEIAVRRLVEYALRESEERNRLLFENIYDVIYVVDSELCITSMSPSIESLVGYKQEEFIGKAFDGLNILTQESLEQALFDIKRVFIGESLSSVEYEFIAKDGEKKFGEVSCTPLLKDNVVVSTISVVRDITERKRLENDILKISEREKRKLGQDLHDGLGQNLTGIAFMCKKLEQDLAEKSLEESLDAEKITNLMGESITQARDLARGLCPVDLDAESLMEAIEQLTLSVEKVYGITCCFKCDKPILIHDNIKAVHLYRVAQEAVHNAIKHSRSEYIEIALQANNGRVQMTVKDDGIGISVPQENQKGMGLSLMNYRAKMIGASLDIRRNNGCGSEVICSFPNKDPS